MGRVFGCLYLKVQKSRRKINLGAYKHNNPISFGRYTRLSNINKHSKRNKQSTQLQLHDEDQLRSNGRPRCPSALAEPRRYASMGNFRPGRMVLQVRLARLRRQNPIDTDNRTLAYRQLGTWLRAMGLGPERQRQRRSRWSRRSRRLRTLGRYVASLFFIQTNKQPY